MLMSTVILHCIHHRVPFWTPVSHFKILRADCTITFTGTATAEAGLLKLPDCLTVMFEQRTSAKELKLTPACEYSEESITNKINSITLNKICYPLKI
jgi:hypothetical protein